MPEWRLRLQPRANWLDVICSHGGWSYSWHGMRCKHGIAWWRVDTIRDALEGGEVTPAPPFPGPPACVQPLSP